MKTEISDCFKDLYSELIQQLIKTGRIGTVINTNLKNPPNLSFSGIFDLKIIKEFEDLDNFKKLVELINKANSQNKDVKIEIYPLIYGIYSEVFDHLNKVSLSYKMHCNDDISNLKIDESILISSISNSVSHDLTQENIEKYIIIFENLKIENEISINEYINLVKLTSEDVNDKFDWQVNNSKRVFSAIEIVSPALIKNQSTPVILGALFRLYKNGDIKYNGTYKASLSD